MNPLLQQLISMGPGLAAGARGNGDAMRAFMESYQRTHQQIQEQRRTQTLQGQQDQDRQRMLTEHQQNLARQTEADKQNADDRARMLAKQKQDDAIRMLGVPQTLGEQAGTMETPEDAQRYVESMIPQIMEAFGPNALAMGMPAVDVATKMITSRQKRQMKEFVDATMKISHVADNEESDPMVTKLPEHIAKLVGKPDAKLSELQQFAELPVGKPAGKTRIPAMAGSLEDYIQKKYGDNPTADQIVEGRKVYNQSDDRPKTPPMGSMTDDSKNELVEGLLDGSLVPSMLSKRGDYNEIIGRARATSMKRTGVPYNAAKAQTEYGAAQRFMGSMNGTQMQRFRGLASSVTNTIDEVKALADEMKNSGVPLVNRAKIAAYVQAQGNSPQGQLASRYMAAVNTLKEEFASLAQGGYAPTEAAWSLANQQINGDYGVKQLEASLSEIKRLISYRMQGFDDLQPYGVSPGNPVMGSPAAPGGANTDPLGILPPKKAGG